MYLQYGRNLINYFSIVFKLAEHKRFRIRGLQYKNLEKMFINKSYNIGTLKLEKKHMYVQPNFPIDNNAFKS